MTTVNPNQPERRPAERWRRQTFNELMSEPPSERQLREEWARELEETRAWKEERKHHVYHDFTGRNWRSLATFERAALSKGMSLDDATWFYWNTTLSVDEAVRAVETQKVPSRKLIENPAPRRRPRLVATEVVPNPDRMPPVVFPLNGRRMKKRAIWRGWLPSLKADGSTDRSDTLFLIGQLLAEHGADAATIVKSLHERDISLEFRKYCDRPDGGRQDYVAIATKAIARAARQKAAVPAATF